MHRPLPASVARSLARLGVAALAEEAAGVGVGRPAGAAPAARLLVLGDPGAAARAVLADALGDVTVSPGSDGGGGGAAADPGAGYDVVASVGLHRAADPDTALRGAAGRGRHLLLAAPREPLAARGVRVHPGRSWSSPGLLRLASTVGAVRDVAHPRGWTVLWVRAG